MAVRIITRITVKNTTIKQSISRTNNKQSRFDQLLYEVMQLIFRYYNSTQLSSNQVIRRREGISYCHQTFRTTVYLYPLQKF